MLSDNQKIQNNDKEAIHDCITRLECLKNEHNITLRKLTANNQKTNDDDKFKKQKIKVVQESLEGVEKALSDAKACEVRQKKMELELKVLNSENNWQKKEIDKLLLVISSQNKSIIELESKIDELSFTDKMNRTHQSDYLMASTLEDEYGSNNIHYDKLNKEAKMEHFENDESSLTYKTLYNMIVQYVTQGKYDVAIPLCKQLIEDLERTKGHFDEDVATMLYIIALVYRDQKNYLEAIHYLNDSLHIRETIFGRSDLTVASTLNNLSVLYGKTKNYQQAEILCIKALEIRESVLGSNHADVAKQLTNLAIIYQNENNYDEAEKCLLRALAIYEHQLGKNDPNSIKTQTNLALLFVRQGKYKSAMNIYEDILIQLYDLTCETNNEHDKLQDSNDEFNMPYHQLGQWHRASKVDVPTINSIFKYLHVTYFKLSINDKLTALVQIKKQVTAKDKLEKINQLVNAIKKERG